jgi:methyl-accepting chemotaxis protein
LTAYSSGNISHSEIDDNNQDMAYRQEMNIKLKDIQSQVEHFQVISEDDFLNIGGNLREYQNISNRVNNHAKNIIEAIGTDILTAGMEKLTNLFGTIAKHFMEASETIEKDKHDLENIHSKLLYIEDKLGGFDKIVKTLRMLGIAAKIESARLNLSDSGFFLLAETVDKMSTQIGERKNVIQDKSNSLLQHLSISLVELTNLAAEQENQNKTFKESTVKSLETFNQKNLICANAIGEITVVGEKLTEYLRNIVQKIQFHDIARQQLQHVEESITEMRERLTLESVEDNEIFSYIHDNLELQSNQLDGTLENFTTSVVSILDTLQEVEAETDELFDNSRKIIGTNSSDKNLHQEMIKENLFFIKKGLEENIIIDRNLDKSIVEIVTIVNDLANQIDMIEEIGSEIELVALNAQIKASHLGQEGASLGVLAEAIQKLSYETKDQTEQTNEVLKTVNKLSGALRSELISSGHKTTSNLLDTTIEDLNQLVSSIKEVEEKAMNETKELESVVKLFKNELQKTGQNISIHISAEQILAPIIIDFKQMIENLENQYNIDSRRESNTQESKIKYTMLSEREIHTNYTNTDIENVIDSSAINDDGLDDNIELF